MKKIVILCLSSVLIASCGNMNKQGYGTVIGATTGGLIGASFGKGGGKVAAVGLGMLAGAMIGNQIGKSMDEQDKQILEMKSKQAMEYATTGSSVEWKNPDTGHHGSITPTKTFQRNRGEYCREFIQTVVIAGQEQKAYGTACRKPDGQWEIIQSD